MKTILIADGGGRGAALVDKYAQSKYVGRILVVPGNGLMQINTRKKVQIYPSLKTNSVKEILEICRKEKVDLVDVAQDNAVESGLVDELNKLGIAAIGPTRSAGQIEWDKAWAREFMIKYNLPSPKFHIFTSQKEGIDFVKHHPKKSWFVKASGLAEGKGAIPAKDENEAVAAIRQMNRFGSAGETYLLEEWLIGEEFSSFALSDGQDFIYVGSAQDHKRVFDGDIGPNTGGMGCVSNPLVVDSKIKIQILKIFKTAFDGLRKEGRPYKGVLYLGGIVVKGKVYLIEFNARWGDPEAEVIVPSIKNDLYILSRKIIEGQLKTVLLEIDKKVRVVVAGVSKGYPTDYSNVKDKRVLGIEEAIKIRDIKVYGAAIQKKDRDYVVTGGRVLFIMGEGKNVIEARKRVYKAMAQISIEGDNLHYRTDIGWRDLERIKNKEL